MTDVGDEEFELPEPAGLRPEEAGRLLDRIERAATEANARAKRLAQRKAAARNLLDIAMEEHDVAGTIFDNDEGRRVSYTRSPAEHFYVADAEAFRQWAQEQAESYYAPQLREQVFQQSMRRRVQDQEPLPPGVMQYTEYKMSRSSARRTR